MDNPTLLPSALKDVIRRHWDSRAPTFDDVAHHGLHTGPQRLAWLSRLEAWAQRSALDVLDVGCGTGFLALLLAQLGHRVVGVDIADEMLERARAKAAEANAHVRFEHGDAERLLFEHSAFDLIVERHLIWTLPDPAAALVEWSRVLRPGGQLVLVEGNWRGVGHADYQEIKDALPLFGGRPSAELTSLVGTHGFVRTAIEPLNDPVLWGEIPDRERYALHTWKPN